jgi:hypothetical protein
VRVSALVTAALGAVALAAPVTAAAAPNVVAEPSTYDFRPVAVNHGWGNTTVRVRNLGDVAAELGKVTVTGPAADAFGANWDSCYRVTLAPGASCPVNVTFWPRWTGVFHATLSLDSNAPGSPHSVSLSGAGVTSAETTLAFSPALLDFGSVAARRAGPVRSIVLTNLGEVPTPPLTVRFRNGIGIHSPGESFALDAGNCAGAVLAPGAGCQLSVTVVGRDPHVHQATIEVLDGRRRAVAKAVVRAQVMAAPAPGMLARRLESAARAWINRPRGQLAARGFGLERVEQPLAGRARLAIGALVGPRRHRVIVASGGGSLSAGTPRKLIASTTKRGQRLLRSGSALKLRATLTFTPSGTKAVVVKRRFRLGP